MKFPNGLLNCTPTFLFDNLEVKFCIEITGVTPAEKLLEMYNGEWGQSVDPVFEELLY